MKPSEYFFKKRIENQRWYDSDEANESTITELDKRFIDREELKDKIIILFKKRLDDKVINDENFLGFNDFKCDILELLEE